MLTSALLVAQQAGLLADRHSLISAGDAYVAADMEAETWTIGTSGIRLNLALDPREGLKVLDLASPYSGQWTIRGESGTPVMLDGLLLSLGSRSLAFEGADATPYRGGVRLDLSFISSSPGAKVTRTYATYPYSPIIETWTTYEPLSGKSLRVSNLDAYQLTVQPAVVRWMSGLATPAEEGGPFTLTSRELNSGESLMIGSTKRSTEKALPWFMIETPEDAFFGGIIWSGTWQAVLVRTSEGTKVRVGLPPFSIDTTHPIETPHGFFGVVGGSVDDVSSAVRKFVMQSIRQGRTFPSLVTLNSWFAHGTHVTHELMQQEIDLAAEVGIELFVLDAGWYPNNADDPWDFTTGLGTWEFDSERLPHGARGVRDYAHSKGLKFGIWVEPERVSLETVGRPYLARQRWLATEGGQYYPDPSSAMAKSAQVCLADPEAWQWVFDRLVELIDSVKPDYLKWDNNAWVNCDRAGHGHGTGDGNFAHIRGLYEMLRTLGERYPDLIIENCSGGGARLDFGMLEYTDVAWMDDQTAPATHVRHNLEGLSTVLPPAYLFSFVTDTEQEPVDPFPGLSFFFRSRMPGTLGLTWKASDVAPGEHEWIRREVDVYKQIRAITHDADARLLSPQVSIDGGEDWDVIQQVSATTGEVLIFAFAGPDTPRRTTIHPRNLTRGTTYDLSSIDVGRLRVASGAQFMDEGIELDRPSDASALILVMKPLDDQAGVSR